MFGLVLLQQPKYPINIENISLLTETPNKLKIKLKRVNLVVLDPNCSTPFLPFLFFNKLSIHRRTYS